MLLLTDMQDVQKRLVEKLKDPTKVADLVIWALVNGKGHELLKAVEEDRVDGFIDTYFAGKTKAEEKKEAGSGKLTPTEEQMAIKEEYLSGHNLKINAFAGTGKTTTLKMLAEADTGKRILLLAYNRGIAEELKRKMPGNVAVYTIHSLAYRMLGIRETLPEGEFTRAIIERITGNGNIDAAMLVKEVFNRFCHSSYTSLSTEATADIVATDPRLMLRMNMAGLTIDSLHQLVVQTWKMMAEGEIPPTHSFYQKAFHLTLTRNPAFAKKLNYHAVFIDEAQDLNPVQFAIFLGIPAAQRVLVGDTHQSIYSWRGAKDMLKKDLDGFRTLYLTGSFRFGEDIANLANLYLKLKGEEKEVRGLAEWDKPATGKAGIISRTNATLISDAYKTALKGHSVNFTRPLSELFRPLFSARAAIEYMETGVKAPGIPAHILYLIDTEGFRRPEELREKLLEIEDYEMATAIKIACEIDVEKAYELLRANQSADAQFIYTTAHSSKGLEFDRVVLLDDFPTLHQIAGLLEGDDVAVIEEIREMVKMGNGDVIDEVNLQYVAVTRARKKLTMESSLKQNIKMLAKYFLSLEEKRKNNGGSS